jgi:hypothetical protein
VCLCILEEYRQDDWKVTALVQLGSKDSRRQKKEKKTKKQEKNTRENKTKYIQG